VQGIDVARYQGSIDWPAVAASGVEWAAYKATLGTKVVDPLFAVNRAGARAAGIRYRFAYHWITPDAEPRDQVDHYLRTIVALEDGEGTLLDAEQGGLTEEQAYLWACYVEERTGRPAAGYSGRFVAGGDIWRSTRLFNGRRPRVFAAYTTEAKAASLAAPFGWDAWQFTSDGRVPGIADRVDLDRVDRPEAFDLCCGRVALAPYTPAPPDGGHQEDDVIKTVVQVAGLPATRALVVIDGAGHTMTGVPDDHDCAVALALCGQDHANDVSQALYDDWQNKALISMGFTKGPAEAA